MLRDGFIALVCLVTGVGLLLAGLLLPAHLRSIDREVLAVAADGTPSVWSLGDPYLVEDRVGPAAMLLRSARSSDGAAVEERWSRLKARLEAVSDRVRWGGPSDWLDRHVGSAAGSTVSPEVPVLQWLLRSEARQALWAPMLDSSEPAVMALLACRRLEQTAILPPVSSASGQPLDASLAVASAMIQTPARAHPGLALDLERGALAAGQGRGSAPLEGILIDLLAAARRLDWEQLATLLEHCEDAASLHQLVSAAGGEGERWDSLFALVIAAGGARPVSTYLARFGPGGLEDLQEGLALGQGSVRELLRRGHRIETGRLRTWLVKRLGLEPASRWLAGVAYRAPLFSLAGKYLIWADGLILVVLGLWYGRRAFLPETDPRWLRRPDPRLVTALTGAALIVMFLASERFLVVKHGALGGRTSEGLPIIRARLRLDLPVNKSSVMNEKVIGMLVAFFVVQLAIYLIGLSRLRSIRKQGLQSSVKLRLLDNEETMFDAPLYMGIGGSVMALVLRLTGFEDVSLMASYSSTLFGIVFCFVLKVVNVRPYRQQLILQSVEKDQP